MPGMPGVGSCMTLRICATAAAPQFLGLARHQHQTGQENLASFLDRRIAAAHCVVSDKARKLGSIALDADGVSEMKLTGTDSIAFRFSCPARRTRDVDLMALGSWNDQVYGRRGHYKMQKANTCKDSDPRGSS